MRDIGHFIGGKEVKGASGRQGDVFNPNTGEVQAKVALANKSEVEKAIANAEAAFPAWAATNPQRRARVMFKFLELIQGEYDDLARLLSSEHGKTFADDGHGAFIEVSKRPGFWFAGHMPVYQISGVTSLLNRHLRDTR